MRAGRLAHGLALSVLVAACSLQVDQQDFSPSVDADQTDSPPAGIEMTPDPLPIMEGESANITVRATAVLTGDVSVTLSANPPIVGLDQTSVVLTPSMSEVTVEVTAFDDDDAVPGDTTLTAMSALGNVEATVDVSEDDRLEFIVTPEDITVNEDMSTELRVRLGAAPVGELTVSLVSGDTQIATVSDGTLEFSASNWNMDQAVTVTGSRDPDDQADNTPIHLTATDVPPVDVGVTVNDVDRLAILVGQGPFVVTEQQPPIMVGVRLSLPPASPMTVTASTQSGGIQLGNTSLSFNDQNFNVEQFVSVSGRMDLDIEGFTTVVTLDASDVNVIDLPFNVQVIDDDMQTILEDAADPLVLDEGGQATFNARLQFQPMDDIQVAVSSINPMAATVNPSVLTFTPTDWNVNQQVTVTGVDDQNTVLDTSTIRMAATPLQTDVAVNVTDLDLPEILLANEPTMVTEGGTASFTVRLRYEPPGPVTVNVGSSDSTAIAVSAGASLSFNPTNYGTPQMVTLSAGTDVDVIEESSNITVMASGFPTKMFTAVVDETSVISFITTGAPVTVTEQAAGVPFTVRLSNPPAGTLVVNVAANSSGIQVSSGTLTFDAGNYMTPQSVTVTGLTDDDVAQLDTSITLSATGVTSVNVGVTVLEDDVQQILEFAPSPYELNEGTQSSFNISLRWRPSASVVVTVMSTNTMAATVATGSVTFTTTDWNTMKSVTLNGIDDNNVAHNTTTIQLRVTGMPTLVTDIPTTVRDLDIQDVVLAMVPTMITENSTANFTVRLAYQPPSTTTISVGSSDATTVSVSAGSSLMFTTTNWMTPQGVTLSAPNDVDLVDETVAITASGGAFSEMFNITVDDQSTITIVPSVGNLLVTEEGAPQSFTVTLTNPPTGSLTVNVLPQSSGISVNTPTLNFNSGNYNTPQTVSVTGLTDVNTVDLMTSVNLTATGAISGSVSVTVDDEDVQHILESAPEPIQITDPDGTAPQGFTFGVRLEFQPQGNTTVNVASGAASVAQVSTGSLTFNTSNWNVEQMVTVTATADANMGDGSTVVNLTSLPIPAVAVGVQVDDQDVQVVEVNSTSMTIPEGNNQNLGVRLRYQPAVGTTVTLSSNNGEVTVPANLSFTTVDYNTYKNASVGTMVDSDTISETAVITLGNIDAPATTMVGVTVTDSTIVEQFGFPNSFPGSSTYTINNAIGPVAQKITISNVNTTLDTFGITTTSTGNFKMAIYADSIGTPNQPGDLVASLTNATAATSMAQIVDATNTPLPMGSYWIVVRADSMSVRQETGGSMVRRCYSTTGPFALGSAWPATFGPVSCGNVAALNFSITTFR